MLFFVVFFLSYYVLLYFIIARFHGSFTIISLHILTLRLYYFELSLFFIIGGLRVLLSLYSFPVSLLIRLFVH